MKETIRIGTFETNSSSTHCMCICSKEEYEKFLKGEMLFDNDNEELVDVNSVEAFQDYKEDEDEDDYNFDDDWDSYRYETYRKFENSELETFSRNYKSKSGDELVVFGKYGYDC